MGKRLLEWGLEKADREGLEWWIEASPAGKPLYEKLGWREVGGYGCGVEDVGLEGGGGRDEDC